MSGFLGFGQNLPCSAGYRRLDVLETVQHRDDQEKGGGEADDKAGENRSGNCSCGLKTIFC